MPDGIRLVGLDVHARESTIAVFDQATGEVATIRVVGRPHELLGLLRAVERPARIVYEACPIDYARVVRWPEGSTARAAASRAGAGDRQAAGRPGNCCGLRAPVRP